MGDREDIRAGGIPGPAGLLPRAGVARLHAVVLVSALFLFGGVVYLIVSAPSAASKPACLSLSREPLTETNVFLWAAGAERLGDRLATRNPPVVLKTLPAFLAWGRRHPGILDEALPDLTAGDFLDIAFTLHHARSRLRERIEHDLRIEAREKALERASDDGIDVRLPGPPRLEAWEQADLAVYEANALVLEDALRILIPSLPGWEEAGRGRDLGPAFPGEKGGDRRKPFSWRVVNRGRHGPKVLRR